MAKFKTIRTTGSRSVTVPVATDTSLTEHIANTVDAHGVWVDGVFVSTYVRASDLAGYETIQDHNASITALNSTISINRSELESQISTLDTSLRGVINTTNTSIRSDLGTLISDGDTSVTTACQAYTDGRETVIRADCTGYTDTREAAIRSDIGTDIATATNNILSTLRSELTYTLAGGSYPETDRYLQVSNIGSDYTQTESWLTQYDNDDVTVVFRTTVADSNYLELDGTVLPVDDVEEGTIYRVEDDGAVSWYRATIENDVVAWKQLVESVDALKINLTTPASLASVTRLYLSSTATQDTLSAHINAVASEDDALNPKHHDSSGQSLYAYRVHDHQLGTDPGQINAAPADHNHDTVYSPLGHNHDSDYAALVHTHTLGTGANQVNAAPASHNHDERYVKSSDLRQAGIYQNAANVEITDNPSYIEVETVADLDNLDYSTGTVVYVIATGTFKKSASVTTVTIDNVDHNAAELTYQSVLNTLPDTNVNDGDLYFVTDEDKFYRAVITDNVLSWEELVSTTSTVWNDTTESISKYQTVDCDAFVTQGIFVIPAQGFSSVVHKPSMFVTQGELFIAVQRYETTVDGYDYPKVTVVQTLTSLDGVQYRHGFANATNGEYVWTWTGWMGLTAVTKHVFTDTVSDWTLNADNKYEHTFQANHEGITHVYAYTQITIDNVAQTGAIMVDDSVEIWAYELNNTAFVKLVCLEPFAGYVVIK